MKNTSPNYPADPEQETKPSDKESMEDLLCRVTNLALDSLSQLSKKTDEHLP